MSEYLGAAAPKLARPGREIQWRWRQQSRLLNNQGAGVLRALEMGLHDKGQSEAPVRAAYEYIDQRRAHLDCATARKKNLPIGSGNLKAVTAT